MFEQKRISLAFVAVCLALLLVVCQNADNDGDGFAAPLDCNDTLASVNPAAPELCSDNIDNNCDGKPDCWDSACAGQSGCASVPTSGSSSSPSSGTPTSGAEAPSSSPTTVGTSSDSAGLTSPAASTNTCVAAEDCEDPDCEGENLGAHGEACEPDGETSCSDLFDNDADGETDCADDDCDGETGPLGGDCEVGTERTCNDNIDNDWDGEPDCSDTDCYGIEGNSTGSLCNPETTAFDNCADLFDNDGDKITDTLDPGCA